MLLRQYGPIKTSSGPDFGHTFKGLGNTDHIEISSYVQDILAYGSHETSEVSNMQSLLDRSVH